MGLFGKLKNAVNAVTGGSAKVSIEWDPNPAQAGQPLAVTVTVTSTGAAIKSDGIFVDLYGHEATMIDNRVPEEEVIAEDAEVEDVTAVEEEAPAPVETPPPPEEDEEDIDEGFEDDEEMEEEADVELNTTVNLNESHRLCDAFELGANETRTVQGTIPLSADLPPSRVDDDNENLGQLYRICGRLEAFGNDPDSGQLELIIV